MQFKVISGTPEKVEKELNELPQGFKKEYGFLKKEKKFWLKGIKSVTSHESQETGLTVLTVIVLYEMS